MILGIELKILLLSFSNSSNTPAFVSPSNCNLFTSFEDTLYMKSEIDLNFPFFSLSWIIFEIASNPTFLIAPNP